MEKDRDRFYAEWRTGTKSAGLVLIALGVFFALAILASTQMPLRNGTERSLGDKIGFFAVMGMLWGPLVYLGLAMILNTNKIVATKGLIVAGSWPLYVGRRSSVPSERVKQFFAMTGTVAQTALATRVFVLDSNDQVAALSGPLPSHFAANQISRDLNEFFGIDEKPIHGVTSAPTR